MKTKLKSIAQILCAQKNAEAETSSTLTTLFHHRLSTYMLNWKAPDAVVDDNLLGRTVWDRENNVPWFDGQVPNAHVSLVCEQDVKEMNS